MRAKKVRVKGRMKEAFKTGLIASPPKLRLDSDVIYRKSERTLRVIPKDCKNHFQVSPSALDIRAERAESLTFKV
jgi:hypothetical protein